MSGVQRDDIFTDAIAHALSRLGAAIEALAVKYQKGKVKPTRTVEKLRTLSVDICFEPLRQGRMKQAS